MQKLIFLTFTQLLILYSPVKLPLHKFAKTCSCTITQHLQIYKKKSFKLLASHMQMSCNTEHNLRHSQGHPQDSELQRNHIELIIELWFL